MNLGLRRQKERKWPRVDRDQALCGVSWTNQRSRLAVKLVGACQPPMSNKGVHYLEGAQRQSHSWSLTWVNMKKLRQKGLNDETMHSTTRRVPDGWHRWRRRFSEDYRCDNGEERSVADWRQEFQRIHTGMWNFHTAVCLPKLKLTEKTQGHVETPHGRVKIQISR